MAHVPIVRKYDSSIGKCENASQWRTQWRTQCRIISEIVDTSGKYVLCFLVVIILDMVSLTFATCIYYHIFKWFEQIILGTGNRGIFWIFWIFMWTWGFTTGNCTGFYNRILRDDPMWLFLLGENDATRCDK